MWERGGLYLGERVSGESAWPPTLTVWVVCNINVVGRLHKRHFIVEKSSSRSDSSPSGSPPWEHGGAWVLVASALLMTACYWWALGGPSGQMIEIDRASPLQAKFQVDINRADWPEIIQLPGLGEVLAQRVLAERHKNGPFRDLDDLVRVDGIGVKTLAKIRPYLLPIPKETDWAAVEQDNAQTLH